MKWYFQLNLTFRFHVPKKDKCSFCAEYEGLSPESKRNSLEKYNEHQRRKILVRTQKAVDKERSLSDSGVIVVNFDLQKVLISPKATVSDLYYSGKLATYNLSVYNMASRQGDCYMWHECLAKRGSCEISTCLYNYNMSLGQRDEVIYYSDSYTGQQRNVHFSTMCLFSVNKLPFQTITYY
jgi:hypothetical protein